VVRHWTLVWPRRRVAPAKRCAVAIARPAARSGCAAPIVSEREARLSVLLWLLRPRRRWAALLHLLLALHLLLLLLHLLLLPLLLLLLLLLR